MSDTAQGKGINWAIIGVIAMMVMVYLVSPDHPARGKVESAQGRADTAYPRTETATFNKDGISEPAFTRKPYEKLECYCDSTNVVTALINPDTGDGVIPADSSEAIHAQDYARVQFKIIAGKENRIVHEICKKTLIDPFMTN